MIRTTSSFAGFVLLGLGGATAPGAQQPARLAPPSPLVSLPWLVEHQQDPRLVVVDAREPKAYAEGHIPGAVNVPYRSTYGTELGRTTDVAPLPAINSLFSAAGIDRTKAVMIYGDAADYRPAAVVFWVLEVHGHPAAAVLNGGFPEWQKSGRALSTEAVQPKPARFIAEFKPERLVDKLEVRRALADRSIVILDSRSSEEYEGAVAKDGAKRAGHIPTALHRDVKKLYVEQGGVCSIQDIETLRSSYQDLKGKRVYTYCNTGRSSALNYLVLRALDVDAAVYDGSWMEWSADENLPVRVGRDQGAAQ